MDPLDRLLDLIERMYPETAEIAKLKELRHAFLRENYPIDLELATVERTITVDQVYINGSGWDKSDLMHIVQRCNTGTGKRAGVFLPDLRGANDERSSLVTYLVDCGILEGNIHSPVPLMHPGPNFLPLLIALGVEPYVDD